MNGECDQCGKCCLQWVNPQVTGADFRRWREEKRLDILKHPCIDPKWNGVKYDLCSASEVFGGTSVKQLRQALKELAIFYNRTFLFGGFANCCPFLKHLRNGKYICLIHETKPEICKDYFCDSGKGKEWI
jgi:Fe-S-cluster containining protein